MTAVRINIMPDVDYESRGGLTTIDSRIIDVDGNLVATMSMVPNEGDLLQWYITKITMEPGYKNNIYILMLALYTFEDFHARMERR